MAFGQQAGPPATARQVQELLALVQAAGHDDFRDARHPLGLTQRQAAGKFTRDEADALIAQLLDEEHQGDQPDAGAGTAPKATSRPSASDRKRAEQVRQARGMPDDVLADELQRRGWAVIQP